MKKILIAIAALGVFIMVSSISIYFLYIIPKQQFDKLAFEKMKYEQEQKNKEEQETEKKAQEYLSQLQKEQKETNIKNCLMEASTSRGESWKSYCGIWKKEVDKAWKDCRESISAYQTDEENKQYCKLATPDYTLDDNQICLLPNKYSDNVEKDFNEMKNWCYSLNQ